MAMQSSEGAEREGGELQKYLKELAGQLWQSQLQRTLENTMLQICLPTDCYNSKIENYQQLLDLLQQNKLVTAQDLSLLAELLGDEAHSLLRPLYEAGFGQNGLRPPSRRGSGSGVDRLAVPTTGSAPGPGGGQLERDSPTIARRSSSILKRMSSRKGSDAAARMKARYTEFKSLLRDIGSKLSSDDISSLKFLCQDAVPRCQLEAVTTGLDLLTCLRKRRCITAKKTEFLYLILKDTGRLDLSHLVNSYYYLHLKTHPQDSQEDLLSGSTSDHDGGEAAGISSGQVYHFHRSLKQLADKLVQSDLLTMKMICSCSACLSESKLEKAHTICDLFALLEEKGKLSIDDISFLEELLADKLHLVQQLYDKGFGGKRNRTLSNQTQHFVQLLRTVGTQLTSVDLQDLALLYDEEAEDLKSGMDLLMRLKRRQVITAANVTALKERLEEIGRNDLSVIVSQYKHLDWKDFTDGGEELRSPISPAPKRREVTGREREISDIRTREPVVGSSTTSIPCVTGTSMGSPATTARDVQQPLQDAMRKDQTFFAEELLHHQVDTLNKKLHSERLEHAHEKANLVGKLFEKGEECNQLLKHCFESDKARYRSEAQVAELNSLCQSFKDSTSALERELTEKRTSLERLEQTQGELELQLAREKEDKTTLKQACNDKVMLLSKQLAKQEMFCIKLATSCGLQIHRARRQSFSTSV